MLSHVASRKAFAVVYLSVVCCLLSLVSCQIFPFPRVENRCSDCVTPLQCTGSAVFPAVSMTGLYIEQPEKRCVRRTDRPEPTAGYWRYRQRQLGILVGFFFFLGRDSGKICGNFFCVGLEQKWVR